MIPDVMITLFLRPTQVNPLVGPSGKIKPQLNLLVVVVSVKTVFINQE